VILQVPPVDSKPWPTLGPLVCDWIEENLVFGPGDLRGLPARVDDQKRAFLYSFYEVHPKGSPRAGRRRFDRCALSLRKGVAKSEFAAWIAGAELHHDAPVRCIGFDRRGNPIGGPVTDPYIPLMANTEEQSEELVYGALKAILELSPIAGDFDIALQNVVRSDGTGKAVALAGAPGPRDGARTTFQVFDETHRLFSPRHKEAHRTMLANMPKRPMADPWALEVTTAFSPGERSVAEEAMDYARAIKEGKIANPSFYFFHRQASDTLKIYDREGAVIPRALRKAVVEASGPDAGWSDIDRITKQWDDPKADRSFLGRVWLNQPKQAADRAFSVVAWQNCADPDYEIPDGVLITLGFDGARTNDSVALIGTEISTGFQAVLGLWERPRTAKVWEAPEELVEEAVAAAFARWKVWRMYADPPYWETNVATWAKEHGDEVVIRWRTNQWTKMAAACAAYATAMAQGHLKHDGNADMESHVGNAHKLQMHARDSDRNFLWVIVKERKDSPNKIDAAVAGILSWQARTDALTLNATPDDGPSIYESRGMVTM
jgi:phage terminase large subunit-like protein